MKLAHRFARWCDARVRDAFVRGSSAGSTHCSPKQWRWPWRWIRCGPIWAHAKKILKADFGGPCLEDMEQRFCAGHVSEWRHLPQWAIDDQEMPLIEAKVYRQKQCNVQEALRYYAYAQSLRSPARGEPQLEWQVLVIAAATGDPLHIAVGPTRRSGELVRLTARCMAPCTPCRPSYGTSKVWALLEAMAMRCPVDSPARPCPL